MPLALSEADDLVLDARAVAGRDPRSDPRTAGSDPGQSESARGSQDWCTRCESIGGRRASGARNEKCPSNGVVLDLNAIPVNGARVQPRGRPGLQPPQTEPEPSQADGQPARSGLAQRPPSVWASPQCITAERKVPVVRITASGSDGPAVGQLHTDHALAVHDQVDRLSAHHLKPRAASITRRISAG